jgi:hypothetical protein
MNDIEILFLTLIISGSWKIFMKNMGRGVVLVKKRCSRVSKVYEIYQKNIVLANIFFKKVCQDD